MKSISFNLFIRTLTIVSLVVGLISGAGLVPRPARANVTPSCSATPLFTNGTFITETGNGAGGASTSSPASPDTGFGYLVDPTRTQSSPDGINRARLADDFTVTGNGWRPSAITLYAYQINSGNTSTITGVVDLRLWNGTPGAGGTVIAGPVDGTITNNAWTNVYRVPSNDLNNTTRPIMAVTINWPFTVTTLLTGTYWLEWGVAGSASFSGPWVPPTNAAAGDNARQLNLTGGEPGTWAPRGDYSSGRIVGLPFVICGSEIPTPEITSLNPNSATAGGGDFTLTVNGNGFIDGTGSDRSVVLWNGSPRATTYISSTQLTAAIPASDITAAGIANVTVVNPGSLTSNTATFTINNPSPTITAINPASATAGGSGFTLTITGTGFVTNSVVRWNGSDRTTTFVSSTQLTAAIPASDIATAGTASVTVFNPTPGGGTSGAVQFTINNPTPAITTINPSSATAGDPGFTLTITGTGFVTNSVVRWNGSDRTTTFVSSTQLTAAIPASDIATAGTASVTVFNPTPGGGTSGAVQFTINNPSPTITAINPASATAGGSGFTLTITGTGFVTNSVVRWNGSDRLTTFVSNTQLTAAIPASDIAAAGTVPVTVFNPAPGGGTSNEVTFTIQAPNPAPTITTINPFSATAGDPGFTLTITGTNFVTNSVVRWNGNNRTTTFVSNTQLTAAIPASDIAAAGTVPVTVFNPAPGGGTSNEVTFTIQAPNPAPTITTINPFSATAGDPGFTLTITGTNFVTNSVVRWNGNNRTTTFVSNTQLTAAIPASDIAAAGTVPVTVFNPAPGGGTSGAVQFTINNPTPAITTINPFSATAGDPGFTLTITGTGFVTNSVVRWNGNNRTTTFVSSTQLTAAIPASDIAAAGTVPVTVFNPAPGGGTSNEVTFTIQAPNPAPTITTINPFSATAGDPGFTLTITGANFVTNSVVRWNGNNRTTTFVSNTQLTAAIPASDIAAAGTVPVTVFNPAPGGGTSNEVTFTIQAPNPAPTITTINPFSATAGDPGFTLTITGTGFVTNSVVRWNGSDRLTTFVSSTQLTAAIPASDIATAGTANVTVFNPTPGGGTSNTVTFTIQAGNPIPTITTISPSTAVAGSPGFTLTITGTGFVTNSVVRWNGNNRTTTFVSSTQLTAAIPASDIATAGTANVTVFNPTPGGGTSNEVAFTIQAGNPIPAISSVSPDLIPVGNTDVVLTVTGSNFVTTSVVRWNGTPLTTTFVSATQLQATLPAAQRGAAGNGSVTVFNPAPGGGESNAVTVPVRFQVMLPLVVR